MARLLALTAATIALLAGVLAPPAAPASEVPTGDGHSYPDFAPRPSDPKELRKAWRAWKNLDASSYVLRVQNYCFCIERPPLETKVVDGEVTSVTYQGGTRELRRKGYDMDRMYLILRKAYAGADLLDVTYSKRGVPYRISIDWDFMIADEEANYTVQLRGLGG